MKGISGVSIILIFAIVGICQESTRTGEILFKEFRCPANPDKLYNRQKILDELAGMLNDSIPEYKTVTSVGFYSRDEISGGFFIYDLTDISNKDIYYKDCINFINNHIYHVSPLALPYSFSHIIILEDGNVKIFKSINCKKGDSLEDVINYLTPKLKDDKNKDEIIERVKNYRKYGRYGPLTDDFEIKCQEVEGSSN